MLEARGIPHDDLIEKTELVEAVENSGGLSTEESEVLMQTASFEESLNFTSERHFLEEVRLVLTVVNKINLSTLFVSWLVWCVLFVLSTH